MSAFLVVIVCLGLTSFMKEQFYRDHDDDDDDDDDKCTAPNYLDTLYGWKVALPMPPVMPPVMQPPVMPGMPGMPGMPNAIPNISNLQQQQQQMLQMQQIQQQTKEQQMLQIQQIQQQQQQQQQEKQKQLFQKQQQQQKKQKQNIQQQLQKQQERQKQQELQKQQERQKQQQQQPPARDKDETQPKPDAKQPAAAPAISNTGSNPYPGGIDDTGTCKEIAFGASATSCELYVKKANAKATTDCKAKSTITFGEISNKPYIIPDGSTMTPKQKQVMMSFENGKLWMPGDKADDKRSKPSTPDIVQNEAAMANHFQSVMKAIWDFCEKDASYKKDPRWLNLKRYWPLAIVFYDSANAPGNTAFFQIVKDPAFTFMGISTNPMINTNMKDEKLKATQTAILLHELGHSSQGLHNEEWRNAYMFFVNIATFNLGINVFLSCNECMEYGICNKLMAPKSDFEDICHCFLRPDGSVIDTQKVWGRYGA
jgi:flagellar motor protein MotB